MKAGRIFLSTISLLMTGFGGCNLSVQEFCASNLPKFERSFEEARRALQPEKREGQDRSLAATGSQSGADSEPDRETWLGWAEDRLKETQNYMDLAEKTSRNNELKQCLGKLANELVSFHGYCQQGQQTRMRAALDRIQSHTQEARRLACAAQ